MTQSNETLTWHPHENGWIGLLPCGFTVQITRISRGELTGGLAVRFGNCSLPDIAMGDPGDILLR